MNISTEKKIMDLENRLVVAKGEGEGGGWLGSLGLIDTNYCLWSGLAMRSCCVALGTCDGACSWERLECVHVCVPGSPCCTVAKPLSWGKNNSKPTKQETPTNTTSELCVRILQQIAGVAEDGEEATRMPGLPECLGTMGASAIFSYEGLV